MYVVRIQFMPRIMGPKVMGNSTDYFASAPSTISKKPDSTFIFAQNSCSKITLNAQLNLRKQFQKSKRGIEVYIISAPHEVLYSFQV
ncbi:Os07g0444650 [Oryza sativa Japonica Group]|uniref:Os07g0444650 protein n=1 Tax=Oryza sativa subsp. japonica TaxID=39947 RepID=A0A0N7KND1_ORYSJ|nr:hypothetical protein EE612_038908 [Oryza sativa]BAT01282.1 Os07g0444650 [Oryza sativa Japonica Group]